MIPNTWRLCTSKEHLELYHKIIEKAHELGYLAGAQTPPLYVFKKSKKSLGKCSYRSYYCYDSYWGHNVRKFTSDGVAISEGFLTLSVEKATATIVHEVAHFCSAYKYGAKGLHHCGYFHYIGNHLGRCFNVVIGTYCTEEKNVVNAVLEKENPYKYELYCPVCGAVIDRYKIACDAVQRPWRYYHKNCKKGTYPETELKSRRIENK